MLGKLGEHEVAHMSDAAFMKLLSSAANYAAIDWKENCIIHYRPVSPTAERIHKSRCKIVGVGGGNRSGKTESQLADMIGLATGVFPQAYFEDFQARFRGPIKTRVVCESLTTVLSPVLLPKLKWWQWLGPDDPRLPGARGHWGWVPKSCLRDGSWDKSWSEKFRTLTMLCRDPLNPDRVLGESTMQFMSSDQDPADFASGSFHDVLMDEPPSQAIWRENLSRVMDFNGRLRLSMTWPDDPAIPVDWIYDEIYEPGLPGSPNRNPDIEWIELDTLDNRHINQESVRKTMNLMDATAISVRIKGQPIRFSNRVHPLFTDREQTWCFVCGSTTFETGEPVSCSSCGSTDVARFNHVREFQIARWPAVLLLDPHPRKAHMFLWVYVDPFDDFWVVEEGAISQDPPEVARYVEAREREMEYYRAMAMIDPNMGRSPSKSDRETTWQDEFDAAGLVTELADDSAIGRQRLNHFLKPDPKRRQPRIHIHPRCKNTIFQMKRYVWDDHSKRVEKAVKQTPKDKHDDYPTLLKYLSNAEPTFQFLARGRQVIINRGARKGAYG